MPKAPSVKVCDVCGKNSSTDATNSSWYNKTLCRACYHERTRLEKGITTPVKHRIRRKVRPSVCKHCGNEPSEDRAFKSRFLCFKCYYEHLPPEKLEAYREQSRIITANNVAKHREKYRDYHRKYYQELRRVYAMYKSNQLQPVELVQPHDKPISEHSKVLIDGDDAEVAAK